MIALDANVLVRCLTLDDASQVPAAQALLGHANDIFVSKTVPFELECVLRAAYGLTPPAINAAIRRTEVVLGDVVPDLHDDVGHQGRRVMRVTPP